MEQRCPGAVSSGASGVGPPMPAGTAADRTALDEGGGMAVCKFSVADTTLERSPGQDGDVFAGNVVDQRDGAPVSIGFMRWAPDQRLEETLVVDDVVIVLQGQVSVTAGDVAVDAGPGEIVHMPKGEHVVMRSSEQGAVTAYVTYPHWAEEQQ